MKIGKKGTTGARERELKGRVREEWRRNGREWEAPNSNFFLA